MQKPSDSDNVWTTHAKIDQNKFTFLQISHLSSNRRVCNLTLYFQFTAPARELTHRMKFEYPERHKFQEHHNSSLPEARELPNPTAKDTNFAQTALIDPSKDAKESIHFSRISHIV